MYVLLVYVQVFKVILSLETVGKYEIGRQGN